MMDPQTGNGAGPKGTTARRTLVTFLAGSTLGLPVLPSLAKKRKRKKTALCLAGQTIKVSKDKKKQLLKQGATRGACVAPTPQTFADDACPLAGTAPTTGPFVSVSGRLAQSFTPQRSGELVSANLIIDKPVGSSGDYVLVIAPTDATGVPTNTVLAATARPNAEVPTGISTVTFTFGSPATVTAGTTYALVASRNAGGALRLRGYGAFTCVSRAFYNNAPIGGSFGLIDSTDFAYSTSIRA